MVALIVSISALLISAASLYLTSLSPAQIDIDHVPRGDELASGGFAGEHPTEPYFELAVFISNTGARGGLLKDVALADFEWLGTSDGFWVGIASSFLADGNRNPVILPLALEPADVRAAFLIARLQPAGGPIEEQARRVGGMDRIAGTISWTFIRVSGLPVSWPWLPRRVRRSRETLRGAERIEIDATAFRKAAIEYWKQRSDYAKYAEIAENTATTD